MLPKIITSAATITGISTNNVAVFAPHRDSRDLMRVKYKADKYALKHNNEAQRLSDSIVYQTNNERRAARRRAK